jgi:hypothetical protein
MAIVAGLQHQRGMPTVPPAAPIMAHQRSTMSLGFHGGLTARYPDDAHVIPFTGQLHDYVKQVAPIMRGT